MKRFLSLALVLLAAPAVVGAAESKQLATGLKNPESVAVGPDGKIYVTMIGEFDKAGDGSVVVVADGKFTTLTKDLDDPKGIAVFGPWLYVTDKTKVLRINRASGKSEVLVDAKKFPTEPKFLNDIVVNQDSGFGPGTIYVSDSGDLKGTGGAVYRIVLPPFKGKGEPRVDLVADAKKIAGLHTPNGLAMDGGSFLLLADFGNGNLYRVKIADGSSEKIADGMDGADGLTWDYYGRLFISSWKTGKLFVIPRPGEKPVLVTEGFKQSADTCYQPSTNSILVPDMAAGTLNVIPAQIPGAPVDDSALALKTEIAFPDLKWSGWSAESTTGKPNPLRPIVLTHAGDGSNRVFVATQHGVIHVFPNDQKATETTIFLD
ncbi:MAG: SMP-30/gluconolactonase/LRE family protein, partial [Planctomycetia bacterium]|nr:SMP-30/gluconolactonase/LRE family protein [Planctomycetia bacterium]